MDTQLLRYARARARTALQSGAEDAWSRSQRAAARASETVALLERPRGEMIVAAAWLHAVGESADIRRTGFVPVDGAVHLLAEGWPTPVVNLVAHQTQARIIAPHFGVTEQLALFERIQGWPSDILDYAIITSLVQTGPDDPTTSLRKASQELPASLKITASQRTERERRLRRALDRVSAATLAAQSPTEQGA